MISKYERFEVFFNRHKLLKGAFVDFLKEENFIITIGKNCLKSTNKNLIINSNHNILINTSFFYKYINKSSTFNKIVLQDFYEQPIYEIEDETLRRKSIVEASKKRLLFLDFEFVLNQYYEVAFSIVDNGIEIQKGYFFEEKAMNDRYIINNNKFSKISKINNKTNELNKNKKDSNKFNILGRDRINYILSDIIDSIDFLVVHHCNSEVGILKENNILIPKSKCICTNELFKNEVEVYKKNGDIKEHLSLGDLANTFDIKLDISKQHFAYYDVALLQEIFFKMVNYYK